MLYVLLAASALAALVCCIVLLKTGRDEPERRRPQWQDEITEEDEHEEDNPTPWRHDPRMPKKRKNRTLLRILEMICCFEFLLAVVLLVLEIIK